MKNNVCQNSAALHDGQSIEINAWEIGLSFVLGCLMMLPILMDLFNPLHVPYGWLYLLPVCLYAVASTSHKRNWTVLATSATMLGIETLLFIQLHGSANLLAILSMQGSALVLAITISLFTHYRLWSLENGTLQALLSNLKTDLNLAQETLLIAESSYKLSPFHMNSTTSQFQLSEGTLDLLGLSAESAVTLDAFTDLLMPGYKEEFESATLNCTESGMPFSLECQLLTTRQEQVWLEICAYPEYSGNEISGMMGVFRNLADDKAQQARYSKELASVHESFKKLPGLIWQYSQTEGLIVSNDQYQDDLALPDFETARHSFIKLVHPTEKSNLLRAWRRTEKSLDNNLRSTVRLLCRDLRYRPFQLEAIRNPQSPQSSSLIRGDWLGVALPLDKNTASDRGMETGGDASLQKISHKLNNIFTSVIGAAENIEMHPENQELVLEEAESILTAISRASEVMDNPGSVNEQIGIDEATEQKESSLDLRANTANEDRNAASRILLVEDDELVSQHTRNILVDAGYEVLLAGDGVRALKILKSQHEQINILITDMFMPGKVLGSELASKTRSLYPHIHTILISGYDKAVVNFFHDPSSGRLDVLSKPFRSRDLLDKIRSIEGSSQGTNGHTLRNKRPQLLYGDSLGS